MFLDSTIVLYGSALALIWVSYLVITRRNEKRNISIKAAAIEAGLTEPMSLHPAVNTLTCLGCGTCTKACPEGDVLGLIGGKAELIEPTNCIGHGACAKACPTGSINLVFGTATRGVDLPQVGSDFQTNVPGIFVAGELGGMGLIRNAVEQGHQAVDAIKNRGRGGATGQLDLVIIGAGPAGLAAALAAKLHNLSYVVIEQDDLGGTVFKYPRGKIVMTAPVELPIVGSVNFRETSKEALLKFWRGVESSQQLNMKYGTHVDRIERDGCGFVIHSNRGSQRCNSVLLAIGRRGTPRKLGVEGEDQSKVVYQFIDAEQYRGRHVLVVGGGDSALEAAGSIAEQPGTTVTLSYRGEAFSRARQRNRDRVSNLSRKGGLTVLMPSNVLRITQDSVDIARDGKRITLRNDTVIICAGGVLPTEFLKQTGILMETKYGTV